jgi:hypothetical protein
LSPPTPLLDFFRRGEAPREVRLLAAAGALAPRAHEQLFILVLLVSDPDPEVRTTAQQTLDNLPVEPVVGVLARPDVPVGVREFFADRGVFPTHMPPIGDDTPLLDTGPADEDEGEGLKRGTLAQQVAKMGFTERLKAALKGSREVRAILIRDPNKMIAASVLSSARLAESEVESFARMANVADDILRMIGTNRAWTKNYAIVVALTKNPKTPLATSLTLMSRLNDRDLHALSIDRNVPEPLRTAARRKVVKT